MEKVMNPETESNTITKQIGQTQYVVRFHYAEDARETMQEKIKRMLVDEVKWADFQDDSGAYISESGID